VTQFTLEHLFYDLRHMGARAWGESHPLNKPPNNSQEILRLLLEHMFYDIGHMP